MKKLLSYFFMTVFISLFAVVLLEGQVSHEYHIEGNTVFVNIANKGMISQTPHTLDKIKNEPILNFTNNFGQDLCLDVAFGFDVERAIPKKAHLWKKNMSHERLVYDYETVETYLDCPGTYNVNYGINDGVIWCDDDVCKQNFHPGHTCYWELEEYNRYKTNASGARVWFNKTVISGSHYEYDYYDDWKDISHKFSTVNALNKKWYVVQDVNIDDGETITIKPEIRVNIKLGENSGKYDIIMKRCEDTINTAIQQDRYLYLDPWWNTSYLNCRAINVTNPVSASLSSFPFMLKLNATGDFGNAQTDGDDFVVVNGTSCSEGGTQLSHEIEYWNNSDNSVFSYIWYKDTMSSAETKTILLYYNNSAADNQEDAVNVWSLYRFVHHLNEGGTGTRLDSTIFGNNATTSGYDGDEKITVFDGADNLDGSDDYLLAGDDTISYTGHTFEAWINVTSVSGTKSIIDHWKSGNLGFAFRVSNNDLYYEYFDDDADYDWRASSNTVSANTLIYAVVTYNSSQGIAFLQDGAEVPMGGQGGSGSVNSNENSDVNIGLGASATGGNLYSGNIDEIRVSNTRRSNDWINATYQIMYNNANYITVNAEETHVSANNAPGIASVAPANNTGYHDITELVLNATITDDDADTMTVSFVNASNDVIICTNSSVTHNTVVRCDWTGLSNGYDYLFYVNASDGTDTTTTNHYNFSISNIVPSISNIAPANNTGYHDITELVLNATFIDNDADTMTVSFVNASNDVIICTNSSVSNNTIVRCDWTGLSNGYDYLFYVNASDGIETTTTNHYNFSIANTAPTTSNIYPPDNTGFHDITELILNVTVTDDDGDTMTVSFMNASNDAILCTNSSISSGSQVQCDWTGLSNGNDYQWYVNVSDTFDVTTSSEYNFSIDNVAPTTSNIYPSNNTGFHNITELILNVTVTDDDDTTLSVSFMNASNDAILCTNSSVTNGSQVQCDWTGLSNDNDYQWYVNVSDTFDVTTTGHYNFSIANTAPTINNIIPDGTSHNLSTPFLINYTYIDNDGDTGTCSVLNSTDSSIYVTNSSISNNTNIVVPITFDYDDTVLFKINCSDGFTMTTSIEYNFSINSNNAPTGSSFEPTNATTYVYGTTSTILNVTVTDIENETIDVTFYNADTSAVLCTNTSISSGSEVSCDYTGLTNNNTYNWLVNITDGTSINTSRTYNFVVNQSPPSISFQGQTSNDGVTVSTSYFWVNVTADLPLDYCYVNLTPTNNISLGYQWSSLYNGTKYNPYKVRTYYNPSLDFFQIDSMDNHSFFAVDNEHCDIGVYIDDGNWTVQRCFMKWDINGLMNKTVNESYLEFVLGQNLDNKTILDDYIIEFYHNQSVYKNYNTCNVNSTNAQDCFESLNATTLIDGINVHNYTTANLGATDINDVTWGKLDITTELQSAIDNELTDFQIIAKIYKDHNQTNTSQRYGTTISKGYYATPREYPRLKLIMNSDDLNMTTRDTSNVDLWIIEAEDTTYSYNVCCHSTDGLENCTETRTVIVDAVETTPPLWENITNSSILHDSVVISADSNESADFTVYYSTNSSDISNSSSNTSSISGTHTLQLTGLDNNTIYYYIVGGCDLLNNCANNTDTYNFTTAATWCGDGIYQATNAEGGSESCDGSDLNSQTCVLQGYTSGTLACDSNCAFDTSSCVSESGGSGGGGGGYTPDSCPDGEIEQICYCGTELHSFGFCFDDVWYLDETDKLNALDIVVDDLHNTIEEIRDNFERSKINNLTIFYPKEELPSAGFSLINFQLFVVIGALFIIAIIIIFVFSKNKKKINLNTLT